MKIITTSIYITNHSCPTCHYEYKSALNSHNGITKVLRGDEKFVEIVGAQKDEGASGYSRITLYGCPKCKTVRME